MNEFIGYCRYDQFSCDYIIVKYYGAQHIAIETLKILCSDLSGGDDEALAAADSLLMLDNLGFIEIIRLKEYE